MESSHACTGSSTPRGPRAARDSAASGVAFRRFRARRHPGQAQLRSSIAGLRAPLSTLRCALTGRQRMTRGHRDSLNLRCRTLSFPSLMPVVRRFPENGARRSLRPPPDPRAVALPTHRRGFWPLKRSPATGDVEGAANRRIVANAIAGFALAGAPKRSSATRSPGAPDYADLQMPLRHVRADRRRVLFGETASGSTIASGLRRARGCERHRLADHPAVPCGMSRSSNQQLRSNKKQSEPPMRKITESTFVSLDGVTEDPRAWAMGYFNENAQQAALEQLQASDGMLMDEAPTSTSPRPCQPVARTPTRSTRSASTCSPPPCRGRTGTTPRSSPTTAWPP